MSLIVHIVLCTLRVLFGLGLLGGLGALCYLTTVHESLLVTICGGIMVGASILAGWAYICHGE